MDQFVIAQPSIETTRFIMRPPRKSDAGLIMMYASDERVARGLRAVPHPLPPGSVEAMIDRASAPDRTEDVWVLDGSAFGLAEAFGIVSLDNMDRDQSEIFYWVAPTFWNIGLATEAVRAIIQTNPAKLADFLQKCSKTIPDQPAF